jgi:hypothetical protein
MKTKQLNLNPSNGDNTMKTALKTSRFTSLPRILGILLILQILVLTFSCSSDSNDDGGGGSGSEQSSSSVATGGSSSSGTATGGSSSSSDSNAEASAIYEGYTADGKYTLKITERKAPQNAAFAAKYAAKDKDDYELTVVTSSGTKKSTGTVVSVSGTTIVLEPSNSAGELTVAVSGDGLSSIAVSEGTVAWDDGSAFTAPGELTPGNSGGSSSSGGNITGGVITIQNLPPLSGETSVMVTGSNGLPVATGNPTSGSTVSLFTPYTPSSPNILPFTQTGTYSVQVSKGDDDPGMIFRQVQFTNGNATVDYNSPTVDPDPCAPYHTGGEICQI